MSYYLDPLVKHRFKSYVQAAKTQHLQSKTPPISHSHEEIYSSSCVWSILEHALICLEHCSDNIAPKDIPLHAIHDAQKCIQILKKSHLSQLIKPYQKALDAYRKKQYDRLILQAKAHTNTQDGFVDVSHMIQELSCRIKAYYCISDAARHPSIQRQHNKKFCQLSYETASDIINCHALIKFEIHNRSHMNHLEDDLNAVYNHTRSLASSLGCENPLSTIDTEAQLHSLWQAAMKP